MKLKKYLVAIIAAVVLTGGSVGYVIAQEGDAITEEVKADEPAKAEEAPVKEEVKAEEPKAPTVSEMGSLVSKGVDAYKSKNWMILISVLIMLGFGLVNKLSWTPTIPSKYMAVANMLAGVLVCGAMNILAGMPVMDALIVGLGAGAGASGVYSAGGKHIFPHPESKK